MTHLRSIAGGRRDEPPRPRDTVIACGTPDGYVTIYTLQAGADPVAGWQVTLRDPDDRIHRMPDGTVDVRDVLYQITRVALDGVPALADETDPTPPPTRGTG